jgi:actin-related protein 5
MYFNIKIGVYHILNQFSSDVQTTMCENIFVTGGNASFNNFENRIKRELQALRPTGTSINVFKAQDPSLDAWKGMKKWAATEGFSNSLITKHMYDEYGHDYLVEAKEFPLSNNFVSSIK